VWRLPVRGHPVLSEVNISSSEYAHNRRIDATQVSVVVTMKSIKFVAQPPLRRFFMEEFENDNPRLSF
jgi:hypothetical protein